MIGCMVQGFCIESSGKYLKKIFLQNSLEMSKVFTKFRIYEVSFFHV